MTTVVFLVFFNLVCPPAIFYLVWQLDSRQVEAGNNNLLYGLTTMTLGTLQVPQFGYRAYLCWKRNTYNPRTSDRRFLQALERWDSFQIGFAVGVVIGTTFLVLGCALNGDAGYYPLLALFPAVVFAYIGALFLGTGLLCWRGVRLPFNFSDRPQGERFRPALGYVWPDLVAVDGNGLTESRQRFTARYNASPPFARMIAELNNFIGTVLCVQIAPAVVLITCSDDRHLTFGLAFAILAPTLAVLATVAFYLGRYRLAEEKLWWQHQTETALHTIARLDKTDA